MVLRIVVPRETIPPVGVSVADGRPCRSPPFAPRCVRRRLVRLSARPLCPAATPPARRPPPLGKAVRSGAAWRPRPAHSADLYRHAAPARTALPLLAALSDRGWRLSRQPGTADERPPRGSLIGESSDRLSRSPDKFLSG